MTASVSTVRVINDGLVSNGSTISRGKGISASSIFLNGHKIRISGSLRDVARQINRFKAGTGVTAEIHISKKGQERLVLKTNKSKVSIIDKSGALAAYFNANKMGIGADKLIEITGANKRTAPEFVYSRYEAKQVDNSLHNKLSGANIKYLGSLNKPPQALPIIPPIMIVDEGEVPDLLPDIMEEVDNGPSPEELQRIREAKVRAQLLKAMNEAVERTAIEAVRVLGSKSKTITNEQSELLASIQEKLMGSGLGETYLRRNGNEVGLEIANAIYSKKSFSLSSTYSLTQTKIDEATNSAIRTTKLNEIKTLATAIVESFKRNSYSVSSSNAKRVTSSIETGLAGAYITFEDLYFDNKRIGAWISSEILERAADQDMIQSNKVVLTSKNAGVLSTVISKMTKQDYQAV